MSCSTCNTNNCGCIPKGLTTPNLCPNDTVLDLINEFYIDAAYVTNIYGPEGGYKDLIIITDLEVSTHYYLPYYDKVPTNFIPSSNLNLQHRIVFPFGRDWVYH